MLSAVAYLSPAGNLSTRVIKSEVQMRAFQASCLEAYLETGLWQGKAGGYGIQDPEAEVLIEAVRGSRSNVKGFPLECVQELMILP